MVSAADFRPLQRGFYNVFFSYDVASESVIMSCIKNDNPNYLNPLCVDVHKTSRFLSNHWRNLDVLVRKLIIKCDFSVI